MYACVHDDGADGHAAPLNDSLLDEDDELDAEAVDNELDGCVYCAAVNERSMSLVDDGAACVFPLLEYA